MPYLCTMRVFLIGYMGCGKTTLGKSLSELLNIPFIDLDEDFEARYRITIADFFLKYGEASFRRIEQNLLHEYMTSDDRVISTGGGTPCFFDNMDQMLKHGITVYLEMLPAELEQRLAVSIRKRPLLHLKKDEILLDFITQHLSQREVFYRQAHMVVRVPVSNTEALVGEIRRHALFTP
ncbi:MAG TPA: shikimate kinase [Bacteroidales bacterium]|mgnify:CR=1 FL=1|nr:shikimate kinase [Bacteroidales bacterium]